MTVKQKDALDKVIAALLDDCRESYLAIAQDAISLGYMPAIKGVREDYADFTKSKIKRTILKINTNPDYRWIAMKFYALPAYAGIFQEAVDARLAYWNKLGYTARCFGCGKCDGTHGYPCTLSDGEKGFLCGYGVIPLPTFRPENVQEVQAALRVQDAFFVENSGTKSGNQSVFTCATMRMLIY